MKIEYLNKRNDRDGYFTRVPIPERLRKYYPKKSGVPGFRTHVTRSIKAASAKEIKKQHYKNVAEIQEEFESKDDKGNQILTEIELEMHSISMTRDTLVEELQTKRSVRHHAEIELDTELAKFETSFNLTDKRMSKILLDWSEMSIAETEEQMKWLLRLKSAVNQNLRSPDLLYDGLRDISDNLKDLTQGIDTRIPSELLAEDAYEDYYRPLEKDELKRIFIANSINLHPDSVPYKKMLRLVKWFMIDIRKWQLASYKLDEITRFSSSVLSEIKELGKQTPEYMVAPQSSDTKLKSKSLSKVLEEFLKWKKDEKNPGDSYLSDFESVRKLLDELFGDKKASSFRVKDIESVRDSISWFPDRRSARLRALPILTCVEMARKESLDRIANVTANDYRAIAKEVFTFASQRGWVDATILYPLEGRFNDKNRKGNINASVKREAFNEEELSKIFSAPPFMGCKSAKNGLMEEGPNLYWNSNFWGPLITIFTGIRPGELWQTRVSQVQEEDGIRFIDINTQYEGQSVKTGKSGFRRVPLHPELIRLGFLDYIEERQSDAPILHNIKIPREGIDRTSKNKDVTRDLTRWFNIRLLKKLNIVGEKGEKVFYCLRHTFATTAIRADMDFGIIDELSGWSSEERNQFRKSMRANYTSAGYGIEILYREIQKINYPMIDFSKMYPENFNQVRRNHFEKCV